MKLLEIINEIQGLAAFDDRMTVYAKREWTPDSEAIMTLQPEDGSTVPVDGHEYFLEVFVIKDWVDELNSPEGHRGTMRSDHLLPDSRRLKKHYTGRLTTGCSERYRVSRRLLMHPDAPRGIRR